jgi:enoyl-CoA hydratase
MAKLNIEREGHIVVITINRPEVHNCLDPETMVRLADTWAMVRDDNDIRVAVFTGTGKEAFCSGADLGRLVPILSGARKPEDEWDVKVMKNFDSILQATMLRDFDVVKPVIAAINGACFAGGMEMIQGMDIRVASETSKFGLQEVQRGLMPGGGSTVRLPRQIHYAKAMEILLTGEILTVEDALAFGLINHVVPQDKVMEKSMEIADMIASNGPLAVKAIRASVREGIDLTLKEAYAQEMKKGMEVLMTKDAQEGPRAFKEKRKPNFIGK